MPPCTDRDGTPLSEKGFQGLLSFLLADSISSLTRPFDGPNHPRSVIKVLPERGFLTSPGSMGSIDIGISATKPRSGADVCRPQFLIGVIEVKGPPRNETHKASLVNAVDRQIRERANCWAWHFQGPDTSPPPLILMGFVGPLFRPYLWRPSSTDPNSRNEDGQFPGLIHPSDGDLRKSSSRLCAGPQPSLWWDLNEDEGKIVFQQVCQDLVDLPARLPRYSGLYGPPDNSARIGARARPV